MTADQIIAAIRDLDTRDTVRVAVHAIAAMGRQGAGPSVGNFIKGAANELVDGRANDFAQGLAWLCD